MNATKFVGEGRGVCMKIAWKERKSGLKVPIQHFFEKFGRKTKENMKSQMVSIHERFTRDCYLD